MATEWIPDVGKLVFRHTLEQDVGHKVQLMYRDDAANELHYRTLAQMRGFIAFPMIGTFIETSRVLIQIESDDRACVCRSYADNSTLFAFPKLWMGMGKGLSFPEWVANVNEEAALNGEEKRRINQLLSECF